MNNNLIIKQYDVDYSFIIKNYLDKKLWSKNWTLFVYKDLVFNLSLFRIDVEDNNICFKIKLIKGNFGYSDLIWYHEKQSNIDILKKQINGSIFSLIEDYERDLIKKEPEYLKIEDNEYIEREMLTNIAEEFLDENGVSNTEIRDVYIDNYVTNNSKTDTYLSNYLDYRKYHVASDVYLVYTKASGDNDRYNNVNKIAKEEPNYNELMEEVNEYLEKLENDKEDLEVEFKECLEAI